MPGGKKALLAVSDRPKISTPGLNRKTSNLGLYSEPGKTFLRDRISEKSWEVFTQYFKRRGKKRKRANIL